ncbi:Rossmann-fold NAD(P)-binding domain-containing protein [Streptomyces marianii]|uniref:hypothetical protein n=1 Tax=Streptomyces marianii TaxID=1817406 RepID=UPI001485E178
MRCGGDEYCCTARTRTPTRPPTRGRVGALDDLCLRSGIVTVQAPEIPATRHWVDARRLSLMPDGATWSNRGGTRAGRHGRAAPGSAVRPPQCRAGRHRTRGAPADPPLYDLPNVLLTPHVAGSLGRELYRMADLALDEVERYALGRPFAEPVVPAVPNRSAQGAPSGRPPYPPGPLPDRANRGRMRVFH